jgi:O-antigen/teichoic acid export membrane protein
MSVQMVRLSAWQPVIKSARIAAINKALGICCRLITIPLLINHLGQERYGLWVTIASFSAYVLILDFGIGSSLINKLTVLYTSFDRDNADVFVSSALLVLSSVVVCCGILAFLIIPNIDWGVLFKLSNDELGREALWSVSIVLLIFFLQLPFSIILKIPYAMQEGWLTESYQILGTVISLVGIVLGVLVGAGFNVIIISLAGSTLFSEVFLLTHLLLSGKYRFVLPSLSKFIEHFGDLSRASLDFMLMQTVSILVNNLQFTLLAVYKGAGAVASYGLITQVLIALQVPFSALQQPMWTRMAQSAYHSEHKNILEMLKRYIRCAAIYSLLAACIMLFMINPIFAIMLHKSIFLPLNLRIGFAMACTLGLIAGGGLGTVLLALDLSRPMSLMALTQLILFLVCVVLFVPGYGAVAMVSSVCMTYSIGIPVSFWLLRKKMKNIARQPLLTATM